MTKGDANLVDSLFVSDKMILTKIENKINICKA